LNPIIEQVQVLQDIRGEPIIAVANGRKYHLRNLSTRQVRKIFKKASYFYVPRSPHKVRLPKHLTPRLLHLVGYHAGDGYLENVGKALQREGKGGYEISYSDGCEETLRDVLGPSFEELFNVHLRVSKRPKENTYIARIESKVIHTFLNRIIGLPTGSDKPTVPRWMGRIDGSLATYFLRGFFDAEGSVFSGTRDDTIKISISSSSPIMLSEIHCMLQKRGISFCGPYMKYRQLAWEMKTARSATVQRFAKKIGFTHPVKSAKLNEIFGSAQA